VTIRVLAVDDEPLMLEALRSIVEAADGLELTGTARDGETGVALARALRPDVVVMDIRMPGLTGVEATERIMATDPGIKVLILTTFDLDEYVADALRAGAGGFLLKDVRPDELVDAIGVVATGEELLSPSLTRRLLEDAPTPDLDVASPAVASLTATERRVLSLVGRGLSNDEICDALSISSSTVRTHIRHIFDKLDIHNRVQAVVFAHDHGLARSLAVDPQP
jgi:DNA-binding NarL/FixJ family response regulator